MRRETSESKYQSNTITMEGERLVYQITEYESLIEKGGQYLIKNTESGNICFRGVDSRFDLPEVLAICQKGA